jgi:hypothetical protein
MFETREPTFGQEPLEHRFRQSVDTEQEDAPAGDNSHAEPPRVAKSLRRHGLWANRRPMTKPMSVNVLLPRKYESAFHLRSQSEGDD